MPGTCQRKIIIANPLCYQSKGYWGWQGQAFFKFLYCAYLVLCLGEEELLWTVFVDFFFPSDGSSENYLIFSKGRLLLACWENSQGRKLGGRGGNDKNNLITNPGEEGHTVWLWCLACCLCRLSALPALRITWTFGSSTTERPLPPQRLQFSPVLCRHFPHLSRPRLQGDRQGNWGTHSFLSVRGSLCHDNIHGEYLSLWLLEVKARVTKSGEEILFEKFTNPAVRAVNRIQLVVECVKYCHIERAPIPQH